VINYYRDPQVHLDVKVVALITLGFLVGSYFGSKLALSLPDALLKKVFAVFLMVIAVKMLFIDKPKPGSGGPQKNTAEKIDRK
jgi:uncharacterized protein